MTISGLYEATGISTTSPPLVVTVVVVLGAALAREEASGE